MTRKKNHMPIVLPAIAVIVLGGLWLLFAGNGFTLPAATNEMTRPQSRIVYMVTEGKAEFGDLLAERIRKNMAGILEQKTPEPRVFFVLFPTSPLNMDKSRPAKYIVGTFVSEDEIMKTQGKPFGFTIGVLPEYAGVSVFFPYDKSDFVMRHLQDVLPLLKAAQGVENAAWKPVVQVYDERSGIMTYEMPQSIQLDVFQNDLGPNELSVL